MNKKIKQNILQLDLSQWLTQTEYAKKHNLPLGTVSQWVVRAKEDKAKAKIDYLEIPELSITLVKELS
jgi:DNA-directed RNA polymerase specialized sigma24 family protein